MRRTAAAANVEADRLLERYGIDGRKPPKAAYDRLIDLCYVGDNTEASREARRIVAALKRAGELEEAKGGK